jgi:hypothetical protein
MAWMRLLYLTGFADVDPKLADADGLQTQKERIRKSLPYRLTVM